MAAGEIARVMKRWRAGRWLLVFRRRLEQRWFEQRRLGQLLSAHAVAVILGVGGGTCGCAEEASDVNGVLGLAAVDSMAAASSSAGWCWCVRRRRRRRRGGDGLGGGCGGVRTRGLGEAMETECLAWQRRAQWQQRRAREAGGGACGVAAAVSGRVWKLWTSGSCVIDCVDSCVDGIGFVWLGSVLYGWGPQL